MEYKQNPGKSSRIPEVIVAGNRISLEVGKGKEGKDPQEPEGNADRCAKEVPA
jgi:hypothetical protein